MASCRKPTLMENSENQLDEKTTERAHEATHMNFPPSNWLAYPPRIELTPSKQKQTPWPVKTTLTE